MWGARKRARVPSGARAVALELPLKRMTWSGKAELGAKVLACSYHEATDGNCSRETHGEFTLETDELRDTVPRVCFTKLHMQKTKQNKVRTPESAPREPEHAPAALVRTEARRAFRPEARDTSVRMTPAGTSG